MKLVLLGPSGAGKGTQASNIAKKYNVPYISTGDIFRTNLKNNTDLGNKVREVINRGDLVSDDLVNEIVKDRLEQPNMGNGYLLDGYPRTVEQAEFLSNYLEQKNQKLDFVININVNPDILIERTSGRRICRNCATTYHIKFNSTKIEGICDKCGGELYQRKDDKVETVTKRIKIYTNQTMPLINYYTDKNLLVNIDGEKEIDEVFADIVKILGD